MSGRPRKDTIDETKVGVYHVWMRCVRQLFLCGFDRNTGKDYSHRKAWFTERLQELSQIFAVDSCVWAILSNHYHLIVRNRPDLVAQWSDEEVARRWWQLCPERRDEDGKPAVPTELEIRSLVWNREWIAELRKRLSSISWFMKSLNEWFSKRANAADGLRGHHWEDRFGCRNLVSEGAILVCSIYIDLNEIRAGLADSPENSVNTSAYVRNLAQILRAERQVSEAEEALPSNSATNSSSRTQYEPSDPDYWMCPLDVNDRAPLLGVPGLDAGNAEDIWQLDAAVVSKRWRHGFLPVTQHEYMNVLRRTIQQIAEKRTEQVDEQLVLILKRLGIQPKAWLTMLEEFESWFHGAVGNAEQVLEVAAATGRRWLHGIERCRQCFT